jgi:heme/copper-type cytochrome/quinol oxidase subunit 2
MTAALWFVANAAEEGRNIILSMLVVGLIFLAVIAVGEAAHAVAARRKAEKADRPL